MISCNRTIMVLKLILHSNNNIKTCIKVAIEPLWYWNLPPPHSARLPWPCCNRTIMVLKRALIKSRMRFIFFPLQSNHYGIETCNLSPYDNFSPLVAIEPLWYWNSLIFNAIIVVAACCNRTIMVLKLNIIGVLPIPWGGCNRTIMVLKSIKTNLIHYTTTVAIEPLWYWNLSSNSLQTLSFELQSN